MTDLFEDDENVLLDELDDEYPDDEYDHCI